MGLRPMPPDREEIYAGLRPAPHLGFFFGKKNPKNPKKPGRVRGIYYQIQIASKAAARQPCFMFGENCSYSLTAKNIEIADF